MKPEVSALQGSQTLEQRIAAVVVNGNAGSAELSELVAEVEGALADAKEAVATERALAVNLIASPNVREAHERVVVTELARDRLAAILPRLRDRLATALAGDYADRWSSDYQRVEVEVNEAALRFADYPEIAAELVALFREAQEVDKEVDRINGSAPSGETRRLRQVELVARGLERFARDTPSIAKTVQLPEWHESSKFAWPPPRTSLGLLVAQRTPALAPHRGADWWRYLEERETAQKLEAERVALYYAEQARDKEAVSSKAAADD